MNVRVADNSDIEGITALLERCYPVLMSTSYEQEVLAIALPAMTKANPHLISTGQFYLVEYEGIVVGCGGWSFDTPGTGKSLKASRMFATLPSIRNMAEKALVRQSFSTARAQLAKLAQPKFKPFPVSMQSRFIGVWG